MPPESETTRAQFAFFHPLRVRWAELDPQGIVFNPNYFMYFDTAVTEYMRAIGFTYPEGLARAGSDMFAVHAEADFRDSARYDDLIDIGVRVSRIGRTSFTVRLGVFRSDALLVAGTLVYVNAELHTRRPAPVPEAFVSAIAGFEKLAPERA